MNKWNLQPVDADYVDNGDLVFPKNWPWYRFRFSVVQLEGRDKDETTKHIEIEEFLVGINNSVYSLSKVWAGEQVCPSTRYDWLYCFGTDNEDLAMLFKLRFC